MSAFARKQRQIIKRQKQHCLCVQHGVGCYLGITERLQAMLRELLHSPEISRDQG